MTYVFLFSCFIYAEIYTSQKQIMTAVRVCWKVPWFIRLVILYYSAEPLKKKKRIDPAIIKQREERKKKRLEKQIRRLEKNARQLKPIDELEVPLEFTDGNK